jgi:hypothetical protein
MTSAACKSGETGIDSWGIQNQETLSKEKQGFLFYKQDVFD